MIARRAEVHAAPQPVDSTRTLRIGQGAVIGAAVLVGVAILADGMFSRALNGIGAVAWVAGAAMLVARLRHEPRAGEMMGLAAGAAVVLAILVRPSDLTAAVAGFGIAGAVIGWAARSHPLGWALLVPGIYLPVHLIVAISRSVLAGGTTIRTDPPPTAAVVPLTMVLAAAIAGFIVHRFRQRSG